MAECLLAVDVIIKLGGCAVTHKSSFESANVGAIEAAARIVRKVQGRCVVVHGAGSFGHYQAHEYGIANGNRDNPERGRLGFVKTRLSVTKLLHIILNTFVEHGLPAVGISPCGAWVTRGGHVLRANVNHLTEVLDAGYIPVLHGDCVLDTDQGCSILSGDKIIETLVKELQPRRVVFLTDVEGVYDRPPAEQGAVLLQRVVVQQNGQLKVPIATSAVGHDVTGGVRTKLQTAGNVVRISRGKTRVFVAKLLSDSASSACVHGFLDGPGSEIVGEEPEVDKSV